MSSGAPRVWDEMPDGRPVRSVTLGEGGAVTVTLVALGAAVQELLVVGGDGRRRDVVLAHATATERLASPYYLGGSVGRYANRIRDGHLVVAGRTWQLPTNDRGNTLHGGPDGFDRRLWTLEDWSPERATFALTSADGDMGFPGTVDAVATYSLVDATTLRIEYAATTDATTVVNLTNHAYLNLAGHPGTVDDHLLQVAAPAYLPVDGTGIPLGAAAPVAGTPLDLTVARRLGDVVREPHPQLVAAHGIDHNYVLDPVGPAAVLACPRARLTMTLTSTEPGLQVYTGNFLDGSRTTTSGALLRQGDGIALEAQRFPDSPHHPEWPTSLLEPGERYRSATEWTFGDHAS